ncbi:MAG TPA: hypothetical protein VNN72_05705 [Polyangiaceae bacterium]|nr:hypothetical protein [Polyangiaceae bacterium]
MKSEVRRAFAGVLSVSLSLSTLDARAQDTRAPDAPAPVAPPVATAPSVSEPPPRTTPPPPPADAPTDTLPVPGPDDDAVEPAPTDAAPAAAPAKNKKKKKKKTLFGVESDTAPKAKSPFGRLEPTGRVFARFAYSRHHTTVIDPVGAAHDESVDSFDFTIPSARVGLYYHAPVAWLTANVELELTKKPELKDAWLRGKWKYITAKGGQFKMPFSPIEMESIWSLPLADRGLIHTALVKELQVAGRRPGFALTAHGRGRIRPSLTVGAFQGSVLTDDDPDKRKVELLSEQGLSSQSFVARAELKIRDLVLGAEYENRLGTPALLATKYYQTGGADLTLDTEVGRAGLRVWLEGIMGSSWLENWYKPPDGKDTLFVAGRLITAVRLMGRHKGDLYVEPYGMFGLLDPDNEVSQDLLSEEVLGVNVGLWKVVRLGLEAEVQRVERNFPQTYYLGDDPDRVALVLQAGAQF